MGRCWACMFWKVLIENDDVGFWRVLRMMALESFGKVLRMMTLEGASDVSDGRHPAVGRHGLVSQGGHRKYPEP